MPRKLVVISKIPFLHFYSVTDAQFVTFIGPNDIEPFQTNSSVSYQVILATRIICSSTDPDFQLTACSDPERVEVLLLGVTEVLWLRENEEDDARIEIDNCPNDTLNHTISGLNASFEFVAFGQQTFEIVNNSSETISVSSAELSWNLTAQGQAPGAMLTFNIFFFTQNETILFDGQMVDVFNGTVKTTYEVNFDFS